MLKLKLRLVMEGSIVVHFREGQSPEQIVESFPAVTRARAYGAIAYYLDNQELIDEYLAEVWRKFHQIGAAAERNESGTVCEPAIDLLDVKTAGLRGTKDPDLLERVPAKAGLCSRTTPKP
jgi:uncharacterized protein DUF433